MQSASLLFPLSSGSLSSEAVEVESAFVLLLLLLGVVYCFVFLALVCELFFVPALDKLSAHLNLSDDVAGATLMAAGSSAPEFFTALIGELTLPKTDVGVGTVIGSAVFNILFVVGCCALATPDVGVGADGSMDAGPAAGMHLSSWPLLRDGSVYAMALVVLIAVFADATAHWWEAVVLFLLYVCYAVFMAKNEEMEERWMAMERRWAQNSGSQDDPNRVVPVTNGANGANGLADSNLVDSNQVVDELASRTQAPKLAGENAPQPLSVLPGATLLEERTDRISTHTAHNVAHMQMAMRTSSGSRAVLQKTQSYDNLEATAKTVSHTGPKQTFRRARANTIHNLISETALQELHRDLGITNAGVGTTGINLTTGDAHSPSNAGNTGSAGSAGNGVSADASLPRHQQPSSPSAPSAGPPGGAGGGVPSDAQPAFQQPVLNAAEGLPPDAELVEEEGGGEGLSLTIPQTFGRRCFFFASLPLLVVLKYTMPKTSDTDIRKAFLQFLLSLFYISLGTAYMVKWAAIVALNLDVPLNIVGLTILAAGTSVPDLLASVIVARQGKADMAVSSSIGSNIFDVLVALPVPWLISNVARGRTAVELGGEGPEGGLDSRLAGTLTLLGMLLATLGVIVASKWVLTRGTGILFLGMYALFMVQAIVLSS